MPTRDELTTALVSSVKDAFKTMLAVDLLDRDQAVENIAGADLICTIGLAGKLEGSISVALPGKIACGIVSKMLSMDLAEVTSDVCDGMGEVANVIAGGVKMRMAKLNCPFQVSIPTVVQGQLMHLNISEGLERIVRHFEGEGFSFDVEFIYKIDEAAAAEVKPAAVSKMSAFEKLKAMTARPAGQ